MNERLMQFRIGMFVIVAGLVLTMMIVWFGESPSILRDQVYLKVRYAEAPGVVEGVPVRKSGIRIGEVFATAFDERPDQPDGVHRDPGPGTQVQAARGDRPATQPIADRRRHDRHDAGHRPGRFSRPSRTPAAAPVIEGEVAPDPSKALAAATKAFESAGDTLKAINEAAAGLSEISKSAEKLDDFLTSVADAGRNVSKAAQGIERVIKTNEADLQPTWPISARSPRSSTEPSIRTALKTGIDRFSVRRGPARRRPRPDRPGPQGPGLRRSTTGRPPTSARPSGESTSWPPISSS